MIVLHHLNRSRSFRILWLLEELGLDYELRRYRRDTKTNLAPAELRDLHPLGKSPLLELDGRLISESGAIVETLCTRFAPEMIPDSASDAYISHLETMHFAEGSAMTPILLNLYVSRLGEAGEPLQPRIQSELTSHFAYMEQILRPSGHFVLDALSAADIMLSFPAQVVLLLKRGEEFPRLRAFVEAISARPAFQAALTKAGPDV